MKLTEETDTTYLQHVHNNTALRRTFKKSLQPKDSGHKHQNADLINTKHHEKTTTKGQIDCKPHKKSQGRQEASNP